MKRPQTWPAIGPLICTSLLLACGDREPSEKLPTPVRVQAVGQHRGDQGVRYSANINPLTRVDLAFKVGGYVREILQARGADGRRRNLQEGDTVAKGTVLARLRESDYVVKLNQATSQIAEARATIEQAKSQLAEAKANLEDAKLDFDRAANLFAAQSLTKADYDAAKARYEMAQARVEAARAQIERTQAKTMGAGQQREEMEIALQDSALKAPMDAVVLKRNIEVGTLVSPGTVGFVLADTSSVKAVFGVPDLVVQRLKVGSTLAITTEAIPGVEFRGQITALSPAADPKSRVFEVEITLPNPRNQLKAGMIASVSLDGERSTESHASVPLSAVVRSGGSGDDYAVFALEEQAGKQIARLRKVRLGPVFGNAVVVAEGLQVGERVIVTGATLVADGEPVRAVP
jgi:multidrug efflux system membrane fusion protein